MCMGCLADESNSRRVAWQAMHQFLSCILVRTIDGSVFGMHVWWLNPKMYNAAILVCLCDWSTL